MKTAWIFPGGSARAVYTAGVMYALSEMDVPKPDILIACSGSAPTALCYVSGEREIIKNVWCKSLSTPKFLNFFRFWKVLNIDYLIDEVIEKNNPINLDRVRNSSIDVYIPLTDGITGEVEYFSNKMDMDLMQISKAAVWVPFAASLFSIKGKLIGSKYYCDSGAASRFQIHTQKAIEEGADRIIVFDNWHPEDNPKHLWVKVFTYFRNKKYRENQFKFFNQIDNFKAPEGVQFYLFSPEARLNMSRWNNNNANANKVFNRGYQDTLNNVELKEIISYGATAN